MGTLEVQNWLMKQEWLKLAIFEYETRGKAGLDARAADKYNFIRRTAAEMLQKDIPMSKNFPTVLNDAIALWVKNNSAIPKEQARLLTLIHGTEPVSTPEEHHERIQLRVLYLRALKSAPGVK